MGSERYASGRFIVEPDLRRSETKIIQAFIKETFGYQYSNDIHFNGEEFFLEDQYWHPDLISDKKDNFAYVMKAVIEELQKINPNVKVNGVIVLIFIDGDMMKMKVRIENNKIYMSKAELNYNKEKEI